MAKKVPNPIDRHVGSRVRMRRMMLNMSQEKLGDALGLTFQQVQKYENGVNRVSAGRLQQIAHILQAPIAYFFDGLLSLQRPNDANREVEISSLAEFMKSPEGAALSKAFMDIGDTKLRKHIAELIEMIADWKY